MKVLIIDCGTGEIEERPMNAAEMEQRAEDDVAAVEASWATLRLDRDQRLAASDWTQVPDAPLTEGQVLAWATYRQELRDLPDATTDPANPVWPTPPVGA